MAEDMRLEQQGADEPGLLMSGESSLCTNDWRSQQGTREEPPMSTSSAPSPDRVSFQPEADATATLGVILTVTPSPHNCARQSQPSAPDAQVGRTTCTGGTHQLLTNNPHVTIPIGQSGYAPSDSSLRSESEGCFAHTKDDRLRVEPDVQEVHSVQGPTLEETESGILVAEPSAKMDYFRVKGLKDWRTDLERQTFEETEHKCGSSVMKEAIRQTSVAPNIPLFMITSRAASLASKRRV
jgi:hypothetical protein